MSKPPRDALLNSATAIHTSMFTTVQKHIHTLNRLDKAIYLGAQRTLAREFLSRQEAKVEIDAFDQELNEQREKAENARKAREAKKGEVGNATGNNSGSQSPSQ